MNVYINLINNTIEYIEENIHDNLSLDGISGYFCVSAFHFNRVFRTVTGRTLKQYILGRKLSKAIEYLRTTSQPVIEIAYDLGFAYPEVFSRAFKKQFGISPNRFRHDRPDLETVQKAHIVQRDIVNYKGTMTLNGTSVYLSGIRLFGVETEVDIKRPEFRQRMQSISDSFMLQAQNTGWLNKDQLYIAVHCHGEDNGGYAVFYGMVADVPGSTEVFQSCLVPEGRYERFLYYGDMFDIRESFVDDLYRWIIVKEVELADNGIGMLNIFSKDYPITHEVQILIPVKNEMQQK